MNLLLTSVGRRTYLVEYFKDALQDVGQIHACNSIETMATQRADCSFIAPKIYDKEYISTLLDYCKKSSITALLSFLDIDLLMLAKHRKDFLKIGVQVLLAEEDAIRICNDKWQTYLFLQQHGINTPKTFLNIKDSQKALKSGKLSYPLIIKPRWGMASIGIYTADDDNELKVLYKKSSKEAFSSHLRYESSFTPDQAVIIQEKLNGCEHGFEVLNDLNGQYVTTFAKKKIAMRAGETDVGKIISPIPFTNIAKILSEKIHHEALLSVDCFVNESGIFITEMNCRFSGHYPLCHLAGVNVPLQIVKWLSGEGTDESLLQCQEGLMIAKDLVPRILHQTL